MRGAAQATVVLATVALATVVLATGTAGLAHGQPGQTAASDDAAYEACRLQRHQIYARAAAEGVNERAAILATMPACSRSMTSFAAVAVPALVERAHMRDRARFTYSTCPLLPIAGALLGGIAADLRFEASIRPHVAIAATGLVAHLPMILTDGAYVTAYSATADVRFYTDRFSGGYVGLGPMYAHASHGSGVGLFGTRVEGDETSAVGAGAFLGWKWIRASGVTQSLQFGVAVARADDEVEVAPQLSYHVGGSIGD